MSLAANPEHGEGRRLQVAWGGGVVSVNAREDERGKGKDRRAKEGQRKRWGSEGTKSGHGPWTNVGQRGVLKGERTVRRSISCRLSALCVYICSLVKRCVAFGIYRASSHLKLICLLAAGSYPGGVRSQEVSLWRRTAEGVTTAGRVPRGGGERGGKRSF